MSKEVKEKMPQLKQKLAALENQPLVSEEQKQEPGDAQQVNATRAPQPKPEDDQPVPLADQQEPEKKDE